MNYFWGSLNIGGALTAAQSAINFREILLLYTLRFLRYAK